MELGVLNCQSAFGLDLSLRGRRIQGQINSAIPVQRLVGQLNLLLLDADRFDLQLALVNDMNIVTPLFDLEFPPYGKRPARSSSAGFANDLKSVRESLSIETVPL